MTTISVNIPGDGPHTCTEAFEINVPHVPRLGDQLYLEDHSDLVGRWEVVLVRHNYNFLAIEDKWTADDQLIEVFIKPETRQSLGHDADSN